jgi:hypothetical protein
MSDLIFTRTFGTFTKCAKLFTSLALVVVLGACSSTPTSQVYIAPDPVLESNTPAPELIDQACYSQAQKVAVSAQTSGATAQYLSAGRYMQSCLQHPMPAPLDKMQSQAVMQLMANATLNFIQGGDISAAQEQMRRFEQTFPHQDLYLPDFTSFRDTAQALLNTALTTRNQLARLNISRELREELERQAYWLSH